MNSETKYQIILLVLSDEATDDERLICKKWLEESEENRQEYKRLKYLYQISHTKEKKRLYDVDNAWKNVFGQTVAKKRVLFTKTLFRYAAIIAVAVGIGLFYITSNTKKPLLVQIEDFDQPTLLLDNGEQISLQEKPFTRQQQHVNIKNEAGDKLVYEAEKTEENNKERNNRLIIPHGKTYRLILSDGTRIWVNSETELVYPTQFTGDKREVTLHGEAFFEVAKDKKKPFYVKTDGMKVRVLGTSFNISCYDNEKAVSTTLVEGSVCVQTDNGNEQTISPSEQLVYSKETGSAKVQTVNTKLYTSWIEGEYIFKNTPLEEIITKLQRWHNFTVNYQNENLKQKRFSLTVARETTLDQLIEIINYTSNVKLEKTNSSINIKEYRRKP